MRFNWLRWAFLLPLVLAFVAHAMGSPVRGRDDDNYIELIQLQDSFTLAPDLASWFLLDTTVALFSDPVLALRFFGLVVALLTTYVVTRPSVGPDALGYFAASILPLYLVLYFNQVRFAVAILIYLFFLTTVRMWRMAAPAAVLGHASALLFVFPPILLAFPLAFQFAASFDPTSVLALRLLAYANAQLPVTQWYFGWELAALALVYLSLNKPLTVLQLAVVIVACRLIGETLSIDVARRALELSLFAYSPICLYLRTGEPVSPRLVAFFLVLGVLQFPLALAAGVVEVEG
jgi:hypothetical protein